MNKKKEIKKGLSKKELQEYIQEYIKYTGVVRQEGVRIT